MKMANEKEFYTKNTELPALKNSTLGPPLGLDITFLWSTPSLRWWEEEGSQLCPGSNQIYVKHILQCSMHGRYPTKSYHLTVTCNCITHRQIQKS